MFHVEHIHALQQSAQTSAGSELYIIAPDWQNTPATTGP